ncbi:hypothetical protein C7212DRAFT_322624 [Tuber magnatum]|uniref:Uncharacterized protein n=1 Tax=Tuber magnatum TaxID=42249 RepID=A0A317SP74_9PEZI|nr:hypothetical protein C7212DRAFT_322624 [Tuber magnatum]
MPSKCAITRDASEMLRRSDIRWESELEWLGYDIPISPITVQSATVGTTVPALVQYRYGAGMGTVPYQAMRYSRMAPFSPTLFTSFRPSSKVCPILRQHRHSSTVPVRYLYCTLCSTLQLLAWLWARYKGLGGRHIMFWLAGQ